MKYDSRLSKEETTLCLLISFYKLEHTYVFRPIYLQKLFEELKYDDQSIYQKLQDKIGTFNLPMEMYLDKLLKFNYLKKRDEINYDITISEDTALQLDRKFNRYKDYYESVRKVKKSLDYFDKKPIEEELGEEYSLIITPEDFLIAFFTKLFSIGVYTFDFDTFESAFSFSILDNEAMKKFLESSFHQPFVMEDMGTLIAKILGVDEDFPIDSLWLGTMVKNKPMLDALTLNNEQIIDLMVKKYIEMKKTIQKGPSVVK